MAQFALSRRRSTVWRKPFKRTAAAFWTPDRPRQHGRRTQRIKQRQKSERSNYRRIGCDCHQKRRCDRCADPSYRNRKSDAGGAHAGRKEFRECGVGCNPAAGGTQIGQRERREHAGGVSLYRGNAHIDHGKSRQSIEPHDGAFAPDTIQSKRGKQAADDRP